MILIFLLTLFILNVYIYVIRANKVYKYHKKLLNRISEKNLEDIKNNININDRYSRFGKISYNEMVFKFWIQISKFYV